MRFLWFIALLLLVYPINGAIIHGTVYSWDNLEPLPKAIVTINTTPEQRVVAENGTYSFVVPPGTYVIRAYYYSHGELELYDEENVTVKGNGTYVLDLILFPYLSNISEEIPKIQVSLSGGEGNSQFPVGLVVFWWCWLPSSEFGISAGVGLGKGRRSLRNPKMKKRCPKI